MQNDQKTTYPISEIQRQFWLLNQMNPGTAAYNVPSVFRIKGALNLPVLEDSLNMVIERHESLRTTFSIVQDDLVQVINPHVPMTPEFIDLASIPVADKSNEIDRRIKKEIDSSFDLNRGPLLRARILRISVDEHIFILTCHHAIIDLRSKDILGKEISEFYGHLSKGKIPENDNAACQYKDYAVRKRQWRKSGNPDPMLTYWGLQLKDHNCFLNFPTDKARPSNLTLKGNKHPFYFNRGFTQQLKEFSDRHNVNLYLLSLTAYAILLRRYSGQEKFVIGVPLSNRRNPDFKDVVGCFVNIIPLALEMSVESSFLQVLANVRKAMLGAHRNQEVPLQAIVDRVKPERDTSYNPVYQVGFTFEHPMALRLEKLSVSSISAGSSGAQLDLFLTMWESDGKAQGYVEYSHDLFNENTIQRLVANYKTLLKSILDNPQIPIGLLSILSRDEKGKLFDQWNANQLDMPVNNGVHLLFEAQAEITPGSIAAECGDDVLTYAQLNHRSNQLARFLIANGLRKGGLAGIYMQRSLEMLVALLAVLKAGGTYVPLDPGFPHERIQYMLDHSQASLLLTQQRMQDKLPNCQAKVVVTDEQWEAVATFGRQNLKIQPEPDQPAYVIYTSGSTGKPKGVAVPHKAVVNFLVSMAREPGLNHEDILIAVTTLSFDIAVLELLLPIVVGAKVVIVGREIASDGKRLLKKIDDCKATVLQATPTTWRLMIQAGWQGFSDLKVLCGGEAMPLDLANTLTKRSNCVWNMYGPTETTVWSTCWRLPDRCEKILVGRPIDNTQIYILDNMLQPLPIGAAGELYIGGDGVTLGYLSQPDLTADAFIPNPIHKESLKPIYRTGDIAKYLPDGNIEVLGRRDHQVKVRGYRIELGEIETILSAHPEIGQVVVNACEDAHGNKDLVAYFTVLGNKHPNISDLRAYLNSKIPEYMVPAHFMFQEAMPLTPNGKIDRKALPAPEHKRPDLNHVFSPPETDIHRRMAAIWRYALQLDKVGIHDRFFDIGGNSLRAVQITAAMEKELGIEIPIVSLFQFPTINMLSEYLSTSSQEPPPSATADSRMMRRKAALKSRQSRALRPVS